MSMTPTRHLGADELILLGQRADVSRSCPQCKALQSPGWESMPGSFDRRVLIRVGTLRDEAVDEPTLQEHHPYGTHGWSADAPISLTHFPYNRCDVWQCAACSRAYLRYTEYGGYYEDERVRQVDPGLVVISGS
jgi:hypothetical protein